MTVGMSGGGIDGCCTRGGGCVWNCAWLRMDLPSAFLGVEGSGGGAVKFSGDVLFCGDGVRNGLFVFA